MSLLLDWRYVDHLSPTLDQFKQVKPTLARARCPICGDSQKSRIKARLYFIEKDHNLFINCHNCNWAGSMYNFLELTNPALFKEYKLEWAKEYGTLKRNVREVKRPEVSKPQPKKTDGSNVQLTSLAKLPADHFCKAFCINRKIPEEFYKRHLYFTPDFKGVAALFDVEATKNLKKDEPRLVIPFYDETGENIVAIQGRALTSGSKPKYLTYKKSEDTEKTYGLDRLDRSKPVLVVEGPIDSLFLPNAVATCDSSLWKFPNGDVYVFDNQPRNKEVVEAVSKAIGKGLCVVIWPSDWHEKDINAMVEAGRNPEVILNTINQQSYSGLKAKLMLSEWRKI